MKKINFNDRYGLTDAVIEGRKTRARRLIPDEFFGLTWDISIKANGEKGGRAANYRRLYGMDK